MNKEGGFNPQPHHTTREGGTIGGEGRRAGLAAPATCIYIYMYVYVCISLLIYVFIYILIYMCVRV